MEREGLTGSRPLLSVVVPVFNQAASIVGNLEVIRERVGAELGDDFEVVVVSDGSIDETEGELTASSPTGAFRVFHYDRNLGKGYAVRLGALEASGEWIGFIDADLDLDPASLAEYVRCAQKNDLDFAIGSKRHPDSRVSYPRSRVVASWLFQQVVRVLFRLNVRDTQAGIKVFRRDVAEQVLPLLLVKRYAFDIELLAVAHAFGFTRIEELPITLDYQFTGSGVRSRAVVRALVDTAAVFYRLRILRYYQRRRAIGGVFGWTRPRRDLPTVSVLVPGGEPYRDLGYDDAELVDVVDGAPAAIRAAADAAHGEVLAILEAGARPAANWLSATVPFFARDEIAAVVVPKVAPLGGSVLARAAAAVDESRIGAGRAYIRYTPGNVRYVSDFPTGSLVVRRDALLELPPDTPTSAIVRRLATRGWRALYTPDAVIVADPAPLFAPHLRAVLSRGVARAVAVREGRLGWRLPAGAGLAAAAVAAVAWLAAVDLAVALVTVYLVLIAVASAVAALRHQSIVVGVLTAFAIPCTHATYVAGVLCGLLGRCGS